MKKFSKRAMSLFLALILIMSLLPTVALAGPGITTVEYVEVFVKYPIAGEHPHPYQDGVTVYDDEPYYVDEVHFFEIDENGIGMGKFLTEDYTFVAGETYLCDVYIRPKDGYTFESDSFYGFVNRRYPEAGYEVINNYGVCGILSVYMECAASTVTVTFDANGSKAQPPAPIQVPINGRIWDAIRNFDAVCMPDQDYEKFWDWSADPFATADDSSMYFDFDYDLVDQDMTLYAMWQRCEKTVDLYVQVPDDCFTEDVYGPTVTTPERANYSVDYTDNFYIGLVDGWLHYDLVYVGPFEKGQTYYSEVVVSLDVAGKLPKVNLYGGKLIKTTKINDEQISVLFSVTPSSGTTITKASCYIETPRAGQSAKDVKPELTNLTTGLMMDIVGWFETNQPSGVYYEGTFQAGKTYYALVTIGGYYSKYNLSYDNLQLDLKGVNVKLDHMIDLAEVAGFPNIAGAMVAVTIPKQYEFVAEVPYGGGKIRSSRENSSWKTILDFIYEAGSVTMEAKAAPGYEFKQWYDADTYETLSKNSTYTFNLNKKTHIKASFVRKLFDDVGAWDYFYEPVEWAVAKGITNGTSPTTFSPKKECNRADVVTFLWRTMGSPEPTTTKNPFTDVKSSAYYYKAVLWAVENGITAGASPTTFNPKGTCTREQVVTFLWRAKGSPEPGAVTNPFNDVSSSSYAYKAILWAISQTPPITNGTSSNKFSPKSPCTRGQVVTFLYRAFGPKG